MVMRKLITIIIGLVAIVCFMGAVVSSYPWGLLLFILCVLAIFGLIELHTDWFDKAGGQR